MREKILDLLAGQKIDDQPAFSGLIHVTAGGLEHEGLIFHETHKDAQKMARAAASTFKLTGMPSATLPLDLCAPAEALGAELNFYEAGELQFPQVRKAVVESVRDISVRSLEIAGKSRLKLICDAIGLVKKDIGDKVVISGLIPGPYTLLLYLCDAKKLFVEMKKDPQAVTDALQQLSSFLTEVGLGYRSAGADFITVHEMGGSPGFIGPPKFELFVLPSLKHLIQNMPRPTVLSVCGNTNGSMHLLVQAGASAISVDQLNDLAASRAILKDSLLFGNLDPLGSLYQGSESEVRESAVRAKGAGADAIWPGCDLAIRTPLSNIKALTQA